MADRIAVPLAVAERWMRRIADSDDTSDTAEAHRVVIAELDRLRAALAGSAGDTTREDRP